MSVSVTTPMSFPGSPRSPAPVPSAELVPETDPDTDPDPVEGLEAAAAAAAAAELLLDDCGLRAASTGPALDAPEMEPERVPEMEPNPPEDEAWCFT